MPHGVSRMIPQYIPVTFCKVCEHRILDGGLCLMGCKWDGTTNVKERPVIVVTYWRRD